MASYIAILRKEPGREYGVSFPDLPGCATAGSSLEEARKMAAEALSLHLEALIEEGGNLPAPTDLDRILEDPENVDGVPFLVTVKDIQPRAVRVNITLPEDLLDAIDAFVVTQKTQASRSAFLAEAARSRIEQDCGAPRGDRKASRPARPRGSGRKLRKKRSRGSEGKRPRRA